MKVIVGMSGGVDSTIAAYILKKMGHDVVGVYFDFLNDYEKTNTNLNNISNKLNIDIYYKNFSKEFKDTVIKYFVDEYKNGRTPNPCAFCNGIMKFKKLYEEMIAYGCDMMATGHYANIYKKDRYCISKSKNLQKDQSYMLYTLNQDMLSHLIFPIGNMDKEEVRSIARELNLEVADKKDSQDVCFIKKVKDGENYDYVEYIKEYDFGSDYKEKIAKGKLSEEDIRKVPYLRKGEFVDKEGKVLGYHEGIINYTIGQRKGLNIAFGERKFVVDIDAKENKVILGSNDDLMGQDFDIKDVVYQLHEDFLNKNVVNLQVKKSKRSDIIASIKNIFNKNKIFCKIRYRHEEAPCNVRVEGDIIHCSFNSDVRAITKGQAAVFYDKKGNILFGGIIK